MPTLERALVIALLCVITGVGWQLGQAGPASYASSGIVSIRSGSAPTTYASNARLGNRRSRSHVGGGFHGGK